MLKCRHERLTTKVLTSLITKVVRRLWLHFTSVREQVKSDSVRVCALYVRRGAGSTHPGTWSWRQGKWEFICSDKWLLILCSAYWYISDFLNELDCHNRSRKKNCSNDCVHRRRKRDCTSYQSPSKKVVGRRHVRWPKTSTIPQSIVRTPPMATLGSLLEVVTGSDF